MTGARIAAVLALCVVLGGCGYVGDPLPPALNIPQRIGDLRAVQHGDKIVIDFTAPALTTESLGIRKFTDIEVRIGPEPFDSSSWEKDSRRVEVSALQPGPVHAEVPAKLWAGMNVVVSARAAGETGRFSPWSPPVALQVVEPVAAPRLVRAEAHPQGAVVRWEASGKEDIQYRVYRSGNDQKEPDLVGTVGGTEFVDVSAAFGKRYAYSVQAIQGTAESALSPDATVTPIDTFAPAAPTGLASVTGLNSIEIAWNPSPESDLQAYRVYRAEENGPFSLVSTIAAPAFSDKNIMAGKHYKYAVSAVDTAGNESQRSDALEANIP